MVTLIPDRAQRALEFSFFSPIAPCRLKMQNTAKTRHQLWKNMDQFTHVPIPSHPILTSG